MNATSAGTVAAVVSLLRQARARCFLVLLSGIVFGEALHAEPETRGADATAPVEAPSVEPAAIVPPPVDAALAGEMSNEDEMIGLEEFKVQGEVAKGSSIQLTKERAKADVPLDVFSASDIAALGASDLSDFVFKMPGISVADGQFAVVRGLSDRFLTTSLDGVRVPSPDPEKQAVQLDLLPSSAVEAVVVAKAFEASHWADSSAGNMDIRTRTIPSEGLARISLGFSLNANAADGGPDYAVDGALNERFGFGSRNRPAPGQAPTNWQYVPTNRGSFPIGSKVSLEFAQPFLIGETELGMLVSTFSDASYKAKTGFKRAHTAKRGQKASPGEPPSRTNPRGRPASPGSPSDFEVEEPFPSVARIAWDSEESTSENTFGSTVALGARFSKDHEIKLSGLFVQSGIDVSQVNETALRPDAETGELVPISDHDGMLFSGADLFSVFESFEYYRQRTLRVAQLAGSHEFPEIGGATVDWAAQYGMTYQKDSPFIETHYVTPLSSLYNEYRVLAESDAPEPLVVNSANNDETQKAFRVDFGIPFRLWGDQDASFTVGAALDSSRREVDGVLLRYAEPPEPGIVAADPNTAYRTYVAENDAPAFRNQAEAEAENKAGYVWLTLPLAQPLRLVGGVRYEDLRLEASGFGRWGTFNTDMLYGAEARGAGVLLGTVDTPGALYEGTAPFRSRTWHPGVALILEPARSVSLRLNYSQTRGRPSLREMSAFFNRSVDTGHLVAGNPALEPSDVTNYDVRADWSPSRGNLVAVSVFRKEIERPIEKFLINNDIVSGVPTESWVNNPGEAELSGFEVEFRHAFESWSPLLRDVSLGANFTWIDAEVSEHPVNIANAADSFQDEAKIPTQRRLYDQPEYIANFDVTWSRREWGTRITVAAFAISDVLSAAGLGAFSFDQYERAHARVDVLVSQSLGRGWSLKLGVKNLTDPDRGIVYDRENTSRLVSFTAFRSGRDFSFSLSRDF